MSPPVGWGRLELGIDYQDLTGDRDPPDCVHFGALYGLGAFNFATGVDNDGVSAGVYSSIEHLGAGILYSTTRVPWSSADAYTQTMYAELTWTF